MEFNFERTIGQIKNHPLFLRLKNIEENAHGWHDHEKVYDHLVKTAHYAQEFSNGNFITNPLAKEKFVSWMQEDFYGITKKDRAILIALIHDCGKLLYFDENGKHFSIVVQNPNGETYCPGHEYWGGRLVAPKLLKDLDLALEVKKAISEVVKVHGTYSDNYFPSKKDWTIEEIISDVKARANGYYQEALFNSYVDCYDAPAFEYGKQKIEKVFNTPSFYIPRSYFIP